MPLPTPGKSETREAFHSRCMKSVQGEFKDQKQRNAVCYSQWRRHTAKSEGIGRYA